MKLLSRAFPLWLALCCISIVSISALAQTSQEPFQPTIGQEGKDVVWVPTAPVVVETMLDIARVTPQDFVIDLGSGDGRNVIAAAKRGARGLGVEYNPDMVELSKRAAAKEGVADKALFVQGDMFEADISQATVLALYLLPDNLRKLAPKFLDLKPGTRIVLNTFAVDGWKADETDQGPGECPKFCLVHLYIVPVKVAGTWRLPQGELTLAQNFQIISGTLNTGGNSLPITNGRLRGDQIAFTAAGIDYSGRVNGDTMMGEAKGGATGAWTAIRARQ